MLSRKVIRNTQHTSARTIPCPRDETICPTDRKEQSDSRWKQFSVIRVEEFVKYLGDVGCNIRKAGSHHIRITNPKYKKQIGESASVDGFATLTDKNECNLKFVKIIINKLGVDEVLFLDRVFGKKST